VWGEETCKEWTSEDTKLCQGDWGPPPENDPEKKSGRKGEKDVHRKEPFDSNGKGPQLADPILCLVND